MILSTTARNAAVNAVVALLDGGDVQFQTSEDAEVATCAFGATAFGSANNGTATANAITSDTSAAGGTIHHAVLRTSSAAEIVELTCSATGGGGEITMPSLVVGTGDTIGISALTYSQNAS